MYEGEKQEKRELNEPKSESYKLLKESPLSEQRLQPSDENLELKPCDSLFVSAEFCLSVDLDKSS